MFACDSANLANEKWELTNPWHSVRLPDGAEFPYKVSSIAVYVQLVGGVGTVPLMVELRQLTDAEGRRWVKNSPEVEFAFAPDERLIGFGHVFLLQNVPFREAGRYEFYLTSDAEELKGSTAVIRILAAGEK